MAVTAPADQEPTDSILPDPAKQPTVTVARTAAIFSMSTRATYDAIARGDIPSIRIGRRVVVPTARLVAMLEGR